MEETTTELKRISQLFYDLILALRAQNFDFCAYVIDESVDFNKTVKSITDKYAGSWIQGANHYTGGSPKISDDGNVVYYESKRVLAIQLNYE